jgi:hypothetical protein
VATPVVPNQFEVGKNKILHKPTNATFSFDTGHTTFKSIHWGRAGEQLLTAIMHHAERFYTSDWRARVGDPSGWINVRPLTVQRVWD